MPNTILSREFVVTGPSKPGFLAEVATAFAEKKINIEAFSGRTTEKNMASLHFVTGDPAKTADTLKNTGWTHTEFPVVCVEVENRVGALAEIAGKLSKANVDIEYGYTSTGSGNMCKAFFRTSDNDKALKILG